MHFLFSISHSRFWTPRRLKATQLRVLLLISWIVLTHILWDRSSIKNSDRLIFCHNSHPYKALGRTMVSYIFRRVNGCRSDSHRPEFKIAKKVLLIFEQLSVMFSCEFVVLSSIPRWTYLDLSETASSPRYQWRLERFYDALDSLNTTKAHLRAWYRKRHIQRIGSKCSSKTVVQTSLMILESCRQLQ